MAKNIRLPRFRVRSRSNGKTYYYYEIGGKPRKEIPLGTDYGLAIAQYAEHEQSREANKAKHQTITFRYVSERYVVDIVPTKAPSTQKDNMRELKNLLAFFDDPPAPLDAIKPKHVRQYLNWRKSAPVRANREKALLSHIWNFAREHGYTDLENPCAGVRGYREKGRDVYIEDNMYQRVYQHAEAGLQDLMDLIYLTGQRVTNALLVDERDIRGGVLHIYQGKTNKKLRIEITGELKQLIKRIKSRKASMTVRSTQLIVDEDGKAMTYSMVRSRFDKARESAGVKKNEFQMRDLRAKAGTDTAESSGNILQARDQLGHSSVVMTEHYIRNRRGKKTKPTR